MPSQAPSLAPLVLPTNLSPRPVAPADRLSTPDKYASWSRQIDGVISMCGVSTREVYKGRARPVGEAADDQ